ncbi:MAG: hypothetical protein NTV73_04825 [Hyphomicrobiales bacterium]|nr:hypothetical protein [Hyphomicrobiales bacterium]
MDEIDSDGLLRHDMPVHPALRIAFVAIGLFVMGMPLWELGRGVWPPNVASLVFLVIIVGAWSIGLPLVVGGIFGSAASWTIGPGHIEIVTRSPFRTKKRSFVPSDVSSFDVREIVAMEGDNTWGVTMVSTSGEGFDTRQFGSRKTAEEFRDRMERLFRS